MRGAMLRKIEQMINSLCGVRKPKDNRMYLQRVILDR